MRSSRTNSRQVQKIRGASWHYTAVYYFVACQLQFTHLNNPWPPVLGTSAGSHVSLALKNTWATCEAQPTPSYGPRGSVSLKVSWDHLFEGLGLLMPVNNPEKRLLSPQEGQHGGKGRGTAFAVPSPWLKSQLSPSALPETSCRVHSFIRTHSFIQ